MTLELNIFNICRQPQDLEDVQEVNLLESIIEEEAYLAYQPTDLLFELENICELITDDTPIDISPVFNAENKFESKWRPKIEQLSPLIASLKPSANEIPTLELKPLPSDLKYAFLGPDSTFPVVISAQLTHDQEGRLMEVLRQHKGVIGWTIADIKGINPLVCTHRIYLEENAKVSREMQMRLNLTMKEVVKTEVLKLLDVGIIYPIMDNKWDKLHPIGVLKTYQNSSMR
ncbi:uncharacterized protein LOC121236533 [Juglans microcarpa x Juglans regia]|uniref:uncharacterized protein LOC121236533 n=1 Tax=Juglans microcarpa x Juglans regia TaxID=2249226 RepID=UPI001B7DFFCA|nr:uncharacterized protein LOC121236533 [Juglans microcarpa x Juglans regia]